MILISANLFNFGMIKNVWIMLHDARAGPGQGLLCQTNSLCHGESDAKGCRGSVEAALAALRLQCSCSIADEKNIAFKTVAGGNDDRVKVSKKCHARPTHAIPSTCDFGYNPTLNSSMETIFR